MRITVRVQVSRYVPEQVLLMIYAAVIGTGGGFGAIGFRKLIDAASYLFYDRFPNELSHYVHEGRTLFMPALGGFAVGLLVYYFAKEAKGHGVPEVMYAVTERQGIIRPRIVIVKALASAITIGSGGSVGREGPIVQIGSAWGSAFSQFLRLNERQTKLLVACGAAAGIAGTFNAPIGGALFAFEIILGSFAMANVSPVVIASVLSAAIGRAYFGDVSSFPIPHFSGIGISTLVLFALLGIVGGLFSLAYIHTLLFFEKGWDIIRALPDWMKPALGGILVGVAGFYYPQILGVGYPTVEQALAGHLSLGLVALLLLLKLLMTSTTIASGGSGGVFAPGLFMGAMIGSAFGMLINIVIPSVGVTPGVFAAVGMATVFAGSAHAPITAMIMLFEMTGNYQLILPLMISTVIATAVSTKLFRESIYTVKLAKRGVDLIRKRSADRLAAILVSEAMHPPTVLVSREMSIAEALYCYEDKQDLFAHVIDDDGKLIGCLLKANLLEELANSNGSACIETLIRTRLIHIEASATLADASERIKAADTEYLMVLNSRSEPVGIIGAMDIIRGYTARSDNHDSVSDGYGGDYKRKKKAQ